jgi:hypothetical protein
MAEPLQYEQAQAHPREFGFEEDADVVTLVFPAIPRWRAVGGLATALASAALVTGMLVWIVVSQARLFIRFGLPAFPQPKEILFYAALLLVCWAAAGHVVWHHSRWNGAIVTLRASANGLLWQRRSPRAHKFREYQRTQIKDVRVKPVRDIFGRRGVFDLIVDLHKRRPLRWRIASRDQEFAERLVRGFRNALGLAVSSDVRHNSA